MRIAIVLASLMLLLAAPVMADPVAVSILGTVEYNQVSIGQFGNVNPGDAVEITFMLDSNNFLDSGTYPTRGYVIDETSFQLTAGSATVQLFDPFPGTPYFTLRDNDPAVDGFIFSKNQVDFPSNLDLNEPANGAGTRYFQSHFEVGYTGDTLSSLDILDAIGVYTFTGLTSFYFTIQDLGFDPIGFIFVSLTISSPVSVEDTSWGNIKALYR
jgi:hypothetical protein